ncbi:hypothetical protein [Terrimonas alba]|uniref:hypothetical protein n=1 Tax=Terrimonas alba TaxID=3349636 RepID=UPI0035F3F038
MTSSIVLRLLGILQYLRIYYRLIILVNSTMKAREVIKLIEKTDGFWPGKKGATSNINIL